MNWLSQTLTDKAHFHHIRSSSAWVVVAIIVYVIAYPMLSTLMGNSVGILSILPVIIGAWLFGLRTGLVLGILMFPLNSLMVALVLDVEWQEWLWDGGILGAAALVLVGGMVGGLRDLGLQAKKELAQRRRSEEDLWTSQNAQRQLARESALLAEIGRILSSSLDIEEVYHRFAEEVRKLINFDRIAISTVDVEHGTFTSAYVVGCDVAGWRRGVTMTLTGTHTESVIRARSALLVQAEDKDWLLDQYPALSIGIEAGIRSFMSVLLISGEQIVGVMNLDSGTPNAYTDADLNLAERIGAQIGGAIANAQLHARLERESREREMLAGIGRIIGSSLDIDEVYERFAEEARTLIGFDRVAISTVDVERGTFTTAYVVGDDVPGWGRGETKQLTGTHTESVIRTRSTLLVQPEDKDRLLEQFPALSNGVEVGIRSFLTVPVISKDQIVGVLHLRSKTPNAYTEADVDLRSGSACRLPA